MRNRFQFILLLSILVGIPFINGCRAADSKKASPVIREGILDLREWDFGSEGMVPLAGKWHFYWHQHLTPDSHSNPAAAHKPTLLKIPGVWNGHVQNGEILPGDGFGSYRLKILRTPKKEHLALKILDMATAYRIYINKNLLYASGMPGKTAATSTPHLIPAIVEFEADSHQIDILVHVSNFHHRQGGMWETPHLGRASDIKTHNDRALHLNLFLLGSIVIMGLYHIGLFYSRRDDFSTLYFGVFCVLMAVRLLATGERYILQLMPGMNYEWLNKSIYLSFYLCVPVFTMYVRSLFPGELSGKIVSLSKFIGSILSVFVLLVPARVYTPTMPGYQAFTLVLFLFGTGAVLLSVKRKRGGSRVFLFGFWVLLIVTANDILYTRQIIDTGHLFQIGFFIFIFTQAYIISSRFSAAFSMVEKQRHALIATNAGYEKELKERKRAETKLKESEEKYRLLAENVSDVIWTMDMELNYTYISPAIEKIQGWNAGDTASLTINDVLTPQAVETTLERLQANLEEGAKKGDYNISDRFELELYCKDGTTIWADIIASAILDEAGNPIGILGVTRDITERKKLETQLQRAQKMEAIGTLAGGVAHDLNNVLSAQVSYPDLILMDLPEDSPLRNPILTIQKSGKKAAAIVQDLLTLARRGVFSTEIVNLNSIIEDHMKSPECESLMDFHTGIRINCDLEPDLQNIIGSSVHLSISVANLVSNAAEAMPGGGNISISTRSNYIDKPVRGYSDVQAGGYAILTVTDSGVGISSADLERIFEPFYTKKVMGRSGTGLGMAVVWGTVKDHKGYVDVESTPGKGTTFTLYFPVTRRERSKKEKALSMEEYAGKGESILVVDDVQEQLEIASSILNKLNYAVTSVSSGEAAIDYMKDNSADLLVLDMIMDPGISGLETYKKILELHPGQKAIIASGFSESDMVKEVQRLGAGKYLKKPYTLEKIGLAVKAELEK